MNESLFVEVPAENSRGDDHRESPSHGPKEAFGLFCQDLLRNSSLLNRRCTGIEHSRRRRGGL
jgi:hypothetical protein